MGEKPIVVVEWQDSESGGGWLSELALADYLSKGPDMVRSVGYLLHQDDHMVVIAQSLGAHDEELVCDLLKVPRGMVQSIQEIGSANGKGVDGRGQQKFADGA